MSFSFRTFSPAGFAGFAKTALLMWCCFRAAADDGAKHDRKPELPKGSAQLSFEVRNVILLKGRINTIDALWMLDTGWTHSTVTPEAAEKAGIKSVAKQGYREGKCAYGTGDAILDDHPVRVQTLPEPSLQEKIALNRSGVLGYNFLSEYVTTIDFGRKQITFIPKASAPPTEKEEGAALIPFTLHPQMGAILVKPRINGVDSPLPFLFDCGSSETLVSAAIAQRMKFRTVKKQTTIGLYPVTTLKSLELGGLGVTEFEVLPGDPPQSKQLKDNGVQIGGYLGRTFFEHFNWTIDYRTNVIKISPLAK